MRSINVISADSDGAELKRAQRKNSYFTRAPGKKDDLVINDAIDNAGKGKLFTIPAEDWERIFGGKHG